MSAGGPLVRRWKTAILADRAGDYERFARDTSLPMFQRASGCLAVSMSGNENERTVTTVWRNADDLAAFEASNDYVETVRLIRAQGFLGDVQAVSVEPAQLVWHSGLHAEPGASDAVPKATREALSPMPPLA